MKPFYLLSSLLISSLTLSTQAVQAQSSEAEAPTTPSRRLIFGQLSGSLVDYRFGAEDSLSSFYEIEPGINIGYFEFSLPLTSAVFSEYATLGVGVNVDFNFIKNTPQNNFIPGVSLGLGTTLDTFLNSPFFRYRLFASLDLFAKLFIFGNDRVSLVTGLRFENSKSGWSNGRGYSDPTDRTFEVNVPLGIRAYF